MGWFLAGQAIASEYTFPYREQFAAVGVSFIEKDTLAENLDDYVVIDARERLEYDTIHIEGAHSIPFSSRNFSRDVRELAGSTDKPLVFYCNGRACSVSYRAVEYAQSLGLEQVYAYDLGILPWAERYPQYTMLHGEVLQAHPSGLIANNAFNNRNLPEQRFFEFIERDNNPLVLDVRSNRQRDGISLYYRDVHLPLDRSDDEILALVDQAIDEQRTVFVIDDAGHQTRWVQHLFEDRGLENYWFLEGGAVAVFDNMQLPSG